MLRNGHADSEGVVTYVERGRSFIAKNIISFKNSKKRIFILMKV